MNFHQWCEATGLIEYKGGWIFKEHQHLDKPALIPLDLVLLMYQQDCYATWWRDIKRDARRIIRTIFRIKKKP